MQHSKELLKELEKKLDCNGFEMHNLCARDSIAHVCTLYHLTVGST